MSNNDIENFDGLTFEPEEFIMRFAPAKHSETPPKHSPVWAFTLECGLNGLVWADTEIDALQRLTDEYKDEARITQLIPIDDDQDILEIT